MKKFDWKKLLVLVLVLTLAMTMFVACGKDPAPAPPPNPDGGKPKPPKPDNEKAKAAQKTKEMFFKSMFDSADQIGRGSTVTLDNNGNIYIKLGIGLDLAVGANAKVTDANALKLVIEVEAFVDRAKLDVANTKYDADAKGKYYLEGGKYLVFKDKYASVETDGITKVYVKDAAGSFVIVKDVVSAYDATAHADAKKFPRYNIYTGTEIVRLTKKIAPLAGNQSALRLNVKSGSGVTLLGAYYEVNDAADGIVYLNLGGNKSKLDLSDKGADVRNIEGIVFGFLDDLFQNDILKGVVGAFGPSFSLNKMLNDILKGAGLDIAALLGDNASLIVGILKSEFYAPSLTDIFPAEGGINLDTVLKAASPLLFNVPTWNGATMSQTTDIKGAGTAAISIDTGGTIFGLLEGMAGFVSGAKISLGYTKLADAGTVAGKMDSFFIDATLTDLGKAKDKDLALKISINDLKIDKEGFVKEDKAAYDSGVAVKGDVTLQVPTNAVRILADPNNRFDIAGVQESFMIGNDDSIPAYVFAEMQGKIDFAQASKTALEITLKGGADKATAVDMGKVHLYYDSVAGFGVAEVKVEAKYAKLISSLYTIFTTHEQFGWFAPGSKTTDANGTHFYSPIEDKWFFKTTPVAEMPKDAYLTTKVTLVKDGLNYDLLNAEMQKFQTSGNLKVTGIDIYQLLFPAAGNTVYANYSKAPAQGLAEKVTEITTNLNFMDKGKGLIAIIADMISISNTADGTTVAIGHTGLMNYLFNNNACSVVDKDKASDKPEKNITFADMLAIWANKDKTQNLAGARENWTTVLAGINKYIDSTATGGTVKELKVADLGSADAKVELVTTKANNILTNLGIVVTAKYAGQDIKATVNLKAVKDTEVNVAATSYFTGTDTFGTLAITVRDATGAIVWPTAA